MSDWLTCSDQLDFFPNLDVLHNIHDDSNLLGSHSQLSADSPPCNNNALEVDLQDELDKILKAEGSDPFFNNDSDSDGYLTKMPIITKMK